jgi:hypothetical protein
VSTFSYDPTNPDPSIAAAGAVRLLVNDVDEASPVFTDEEIAAFLALEGGIVKLAAATAIDTNADNEALASKVLRTQDLSTDGAKLADALHKRAEALRAQYFSDDFTFDVIDLSDDAATLAAMDLN